MSWTILEISLCLFENLLFFIFLSRLLPKRIKNKWIIAGVIIVKSSIDYSVCNLDQLPKALICICAGTLAALILYNTRLFICSLFFIMFFYIMCIIDLIIGNVITIFSEQNIVLIFYDNFIQRLILCIIVKLLDCFIFYLLYRLYKKISLDINTKFWVLFNIIMTVFLIITLIFMTDYPDIQPNLSTEIIYTALSFLFFIMSLIVIYFFTYIAYSFKYHEEMRILQQGYKSIEESLIGQTENSEQLKKIRHDIKNHLNLILILIKSKEYESASKVLSEVIGQTDLICIGLSQSTGNNILDAIISQKSAVMKNMGISFEYHLDKLPPLSLDPMDISSVISNMLDNAMEAAICSDKPFAELKVLMIDAYLTINVKNTYSGIFTGSNYDHTHLKTTKDNKYMHGYGINIIKTLSEKNGGTFSWKADGQYFNANVIMNNHMQNANSR